MPVIPWTEIGSFNNIRNYVTAFPDLVKGAITYRAKIKLHGENHAIQIHEEDVICQSRSVILTSEKDNNGFAKYVSKFTNKLLSSPAKGFILFGEWCGPGIQSGTALNQLPEKLFALFAARPLDTEDDRLIVEPEELKTLTNGLESWISILPWHNDPIEIDWSADDATVGVQAALINELVMAVEQNDPWVESMFGVKGTGEGIVLYPVSRPGYKYYCTFVFKAKGEAHRVIKTKVAAQVNPEVAANATLFTGLVLTTARLEQGSRAVSEDGSLTFNLKSIGKFITWILSDVQKECADELMVSKLSFSKDVNKPLADKARIWYLSQIKK
jgi:RNA ligase